MEELPSFDLEKLDKNFMKMIVDNSPSAYIVIDLNYNIVFVNEYVMKLRGFTAEQLINQKCFNITNGGCICNDCPVKPVMENGKTNKILKEEVDIWGKTKYSEVLAVPLLKDDGTFEHVIEIITDKTEEITLNKQIENNFLKLLDSFCTAIEAKDHYTGNHSQAVKKYSMLLGEKVGLSDVDLRELLVASSLHDIGKIGISDSIINKPIKLNDEEYEIMKSHPAVGGEILKKLEGFKNIRNVVRYHHERPDGHGYPDGIKGEEIPYLSRIISIADSFDAMTSTRPYRKALNISYAREQLSKYKGTQFDSDLVDVFVQMIDANEIVVDTE